MSINKLILSYVILFHSIISLPSDEIWKKTLEYIEEGKMIIPEHKYYFIFDEKNYTALDINSYKMKKLYELQENIYLEHNLSNYIFIVDSVDEKKESIENTAINIGETSQKYFKVNVTNAVLALFSMKTRKATIRTGETAKYFLSDKKLSEIIQDLGFYMRNKHYYDAWIKLLEKIYEKYGKSDIGDKMEDFLVDLFKAPILIGLVYLLLYILKFVIILVIFIIRFIIDIYWMTYDCLFGKKKLPNDSDLKKIVNFFNKQSSNKKILTDNCAICLEEFRKSSNEENDNNGEKENSKIEKMLPKENDEKNISLLECGHQFHTHCIKKWMKRKIECPLCRQKINPIYNKDDAKMVWGVQNEIHNNRFSNISFKDLFILEFRKPYTFHSYDFEFFSSSGGVSSERSGGGGFSSGGGATGGW